jgi:hypothetical protein
MKNSFYSCAAGKSPLPPARHVRPYLKDDKTPKRRIFSHHSALIDEKISRRWAFRQFANKA